MGHQHRPRALLTIDDSETRYIDNLAYLARLKQPLLPFNTKDQHRILATLRFNDEQTFDFNR